MKITIDVNHYLHFASDPTLDAALSDIKTKLEAIMATQAELEATLNQINEKLVEAQAEITAKIQALIDAVAAAGNTTPGVDAAAAAALATAGTLADIGNP